MANVKPEQRIQSLGENIDIANRLCLRQPVKLRRNVAPTQGSRDGERRIGPIELTERQQRASQCRGCRWVNRRGSHRSLRLDQCRTRIIMCEIAECDLGCRVASEERRLRMRRADRKSAV